LQRNKKAGVPMYAKPLVINVCLFLGSVVLSLVFAEGFLQLFPGLLPAEVRQLVEDGPSNQGVSHPYIGHLHTPNKAFVLSATDFSATHHVDGYGFRNPWPWPTQSDIVTVGDSLAFGHGVEDEQTWPAIIARSLPSNRVINLGLSGAGAQQYLRVYETFGIKLQPKVLLVGFFVRNDFWDDALFDRWLRSGVGGNYMVWRNFGRPRRVSFSLQRPLGSIMDVLRWNHALFSRSSYLYTLLLHVRGAVQKWRPAEVRIFEFSDGGRMELFPGDFANTTAGAQPDRREFHLVLQALQRIHSIARANGTHVLVIFQPSKEEVYLPLLGEALPDPARPLKTELEKHRIDYLELTPAFRRRAEAGEKLFFEVDGHPNARGYALIADLVLSHLKDNAKRYGLKDFGESSSP
jgi:GDSL-like Lipase/Acylhydrolase family